jgi:hypothetical protein
MNLLSDYLTADARIQPIELSAQSAAQLPKALSDSIVSVKYLDSRSIVDNCAVRERGISLTTESAGST